MKRRRQAGVQGQAPLDAEAGYMLLAVVIMVALVVIALAVAAPVVARELRRDKEVESQHRAQQYLRAIRMYYRKNKSYPASLKALQNTNNVRYLRQEYVDPLTGKADWKFIHQGEQKTKIHVFFGQELAGLTAGLGSAAGMQSGGAGTGGSSSTSTISAGGLAGGFNGASITTGTNGTPGTGGTGTGTTGNGTSAFGDGTGGIIVGVATAKTGDSITSPNQQTTYESWEFWYDPRIELLYQKGQQSALGGASASTSASNFGKDAVTGQSNTPGSSLPGSTSTGPGTGTSPNPNGP